MRSFIGLGSNLGDRERYLRRALDLLRADPALEVVTVSTFRETDPVGFVEHVRHAAVRVARRRANTGSWVVRVKSANAGG
jgi:7,8-dihydro-6-hydroxymethylpterin-pyrophosphokinase